MENEKMLNSKTGEKRNFCLSLGFHLVLLVSIGAELGHLSHERDHVSSNSRTLVVVDR